MEVVDDGWVFVTVAAAGVLVGAAGVDVVRDHRRAAFPITQGWQAVSSRTKIYEYLVWEPRSSRSPVNDGLG